MSKPRKFKCEEYCKDYETCTLTDCNRSILFLHGETTLMVEPGIAKPITIKIKKDIWSGSRVTKINDVY